MRHRATCGNVLNMVAGVRGLPDRKRLPHAIPASVDAEGSCFFITIACQERNADRLCSERVASIVFDAAAHYVRLALWHPTLVMIMPDHLHLITALNLRERDIRGIVEPWKGWVRKQTGVEWQRGFFDHRLRNQQAAQEKADYVLMNPVRKGLAATPEAWPWKRVPPW